MNTARAPRAISSTRLLTRSAIIWFTLSLMLAIVDAFGVVRAFGSAGALTFWMVLVGVNIVGWHGWRHTILRGDRIDGRWVLGAVLLNGLLCLEVPLLYRLMGRSDVTIDWRPALYGLLATAFVVFLKAGLARPAAQVDGPPPDKVITPVQSPRAGILARAGISDPFDVLCVCAEDHYCRLSLRNGQTLLVHYRFKDAIADLANVPGAQVHRSTWVADHAVTGAQRSGRRWSLKLTDGESVVVSESSVALCRARGWLTPGDGLA
ncbi:LytTR family DNA-binding domain-containing protein [Sphingomonas sp. Leaf23]|uniref:LytTR family DNA-binding domain-containing protein n=1 Tax=Sphingomonas sp. Leaf23 TaxID=1735689 RepID=UPI000B2F133D|nr:LytTR family DNA-binding domain-containing protein [Sphingomonas sp. Leaf23]